MLDALCRDEIDSLPGFSSFFAAPFYFSKRMYAVIIGQGEIENFKQFRQIILQPLVSIAELQFNYNTLQQQLSRYQNELEQFVPFITQEFKTPIQNVRNLITLIKSDLQNELPQEAESYLNRMQRNLNGMERMGNALAQYYRMEQRRDFQYVDMHQVTRSVLADFQVSLRDNNIHVKVDESLPTIQADPTAMQQLWTSLISNAVKFCRSAQSPTIKIGWHERGTVAEFFIEDNGIGISSDLHDKIFDLFYTKSDQADKSTGIGLAIAGKAVEMHGGLIWVESQIGRGATFRFRLPKRSHVLPT